RGFQRGVDRMPVQSASRGEAKIAEHPKRREERRMRNERDDQVASNGQPRPGEQAWGKRAVRFCVSRGHDYRRFGGVKGSVIIPTLVMPARCAAAITSITVP